MVLAHICSVLLLANLYYGNTLHNHPMFGTLVMVLQTQGFTGFDGDAFDLVARFFFECCIRPSRAIDCCRQVGTVMLALF